MEQITTYMAMGSKLSKDKDGIKRVAYMVSYATGKSYDEAVDFIRDCEKNGKRLIFAYPPFDMDSSEWESLGTIEDGELYLG